MFISEEKEESKQSEEKGEEEEESKQSEEKPI